MNNYNDEPELIILIDKYLEGLDCSVLEKTWLKEHIYQFVKKNADNLYWKVLLI